MSTKEIHGLFGDEEILLASAKKLVIPSSLNFVIAKLSNLEPILFLRAKLANEKSITHF